MDTPGHIVHHNNYVPATGGVGTLLRIHGEHEGDKSAFVGFRSPRSTSWQPGRIGLGAQARTPIRRLRRNYLACRERAGAYQYSLYHNFWGLSMVSDLDPSRLRGAFVHSDFPCFERLVKQLAPMLDFMVNNSGILHERCRELLPEWGDDRFIWVPQPIVWPSPPAGHWEDSVKETEPIVIGMACRVTRAQKQMQRLPELLAAFDRVLPPYRFELLGDGDYLERLRQRLGHRRNVVFHGWVDSQGEDYWSIIKRWRYVALISRYESLALTVLEAAGMGAIPVYPDFHDGDDFWPQLDPRFAYAVNDLGAAARRVSEWEKMGREERSRARAKLRVVSAQFHREAYLRAFDQGLEKLSVLGPRSSRVNRCLHPEWGTLTFHNYHLKRLRFGRWGFVWHR